MSTLKNLLILANVGLVYFLSHSFALLFLTVYYFLLLFLFLSSLPFISNVVTMQAQRTAPPDMVCKDKFLIQGRIVPDGTTDENITPSMVSFCSFCSWFSILASHRLFWQFAKDGGKYIEENKLRVTLVSPPHSPVLSPINGALKQGLAYEAPKLKSQVSGRVETKQTVR